MPAGTVVIVLKRWRHLGSVDRDLPGQWRCLLRSLHAVRKGHGARMRTEAGGRRGGDNTGWSLRLLEVRHLAGEGTVRSRPGRLMLRSGSQRGMRRRL